MLLLGALCFVCCFAAYLPNAYGQAGTLRPSTNPPTTYPPPVTTPPPRVTTPPQDCGNVFNNGLTSPGYPNNYPNGMDCDYWVRILPGMAKKIRFNYFYLESASLCRYDYLRIVNDNNQAFGKYCGFYRPGFTVTVTGQYVNISFHSDGSVNKRGYNISFSDVPLGTLRPSTNPPTTTQSPVTTQRPSPGCGAVVNDTLKSPGYPSYYPSNLNCNYTVLIPHGMAMNIYFSDFHVEDHPSCWYDYLKIENDYSQFFGKYCGQRSGINVVVTGNYAVITFHSDSSWQERGYQLVFSYFPLATLSPSAASSTNAPSSTAAPTVKPTGCPTAGPGSDPQSRLKYYIALLRLLLDQMEQIVDNDLGCNSSITKREHIERVEKTIHNVDAAMTSAGRQKRDVTQTMVVDQLKKKAADLMSKLKNKQQDAATKSAGRQKRDVSDTMMVGQLKKKAANLMNDFKDKQGHYKRKPQLNAREKKRVAEERPLMKNVAENIAEKLFNTKGKNVKSVV